MIITEAIQHVINGALGAQSIDKYGFPVGSRIADHNNSYQRPILMGTDGSVLSWVYDEVTSTAERRRGDFKTPTPYYVEQTKKKGNVHAKIRASYNKYTVPLREWPLGGANPRAGSVRSFAFFPRLQGDAQALVNNKILDAASQWSAAVDAAELGQTVGLLGDLSSRFLGITAGVIKRDPKLLLESFGLKPTKRLRKRTTRKFRELAKQQGLQVGDAVAEFWLMYRYGINPLIMSLDDFRNALLSDYKPEFHSQVTVTREESYFATKPTEGVHQSGAVLYTYDETGYYKKSVRIKTVVSFRDSLRARIRGNPVAEILGTGWELLPYSFIFDWVVGVGDYINQLNLETLLASYKSVITTKGLTRFESRVYNIRRNTANANSDYQFMEKPNWARNETRSFERAIGTGPTLGNLLWGTGLSPTKRKLDSAALTFTKVRQLNSSKFH